MNTGRREGDGSIMAAMDFTEAEWRLTGATLSDKTASSEYGLSQDEIVAAIRAGKLQYRPGSTHGNPWYRLLRREVEELVKDQHGERYLRERLARTELARVNRDLKRLRMEVAGLEELQNELRSALG